MIELLAAAFVVLGVSTAGMICGAVEEEHTCSSANTVMVLSFLLGACVARILIACGWLR